MKKCICNDISEHSPGGRCEAKHPKKYNLTFLQRLLLIPVWLYWVKLPDKDRKTWHEVKKGMETHEHEYTILTYEEGRKYLKCNHEGCNLCVPTN